MKKMRTWQNGLEIGHSPETGTWKYHAHVMTGSQTNGNWSEDRCHGIKNLGGEDVHRHEKPPDLGTRVWSTDIDNDIVPDRETEE